MEAALLATEAHARLGLIIQQADSALAQMRERERLARRLRAGRRSRPRALAAS